MSHHEYTSVLLDKDWNKCSFPSIQCATRYFERGDYKRYGVRLHVGAVTVRQVVEFSVRLRAIDSTLRLTGLALLNRTPESEAFDAEFEIAYRVFAPDRVRPPTRSENVATGDSSGG